MSNIINADNGVVSGIAGVKLSSDSTGVLNIQTNGTTAITISTAQVVSLTNSPTFTGGTANGVLYLNASKVATSGSALVFDGTNLGLGATPATWIANFKAIEGTYLTLADRSDANNAYFGSNFKRVSGTDWTYKNTGAATMYQTGGQHIWWYVGSGTANTAITWLEGMRLDSSGNLGIGTASPLYRLHVRTEGDVRIYAEDDAANSRGGYLRSVTGGVVTLGTTSGVRDLVFAPDNTERMRVMVGGNVGIGTTSPGVKLEVQSSASLARFRNNTSSATTSYITVVNVNNSSNGLVMAHIDDGTGYFGTQTNTALRFVTNDTERARFNATGAFVFAGGTTTADGIGITFPATQSASSNANTLDDYEEGSWTPTAVCTGQTIAYTSRSGSYTKIGNTVRAQCLMVISTVSGAAGGNTTITGLPFSNGGGTYSGQGAIGYNDGFAGTVYGTWISGTDALFRSGTRSSGNDASGFTAGGYIYIVWIYNV